MEKQNWSNIIDSKHSYLDLKLKEVWEYRDLIYMLVKRDFITGFKQTILGPLWFFINPILTTIMYVVIFGNVAKLSTDGAPQIVFYLAGVTLWNYFSSCLLSISTVFRSNANVFGKVYFPRLIMPLSIVISNLMKFLVQYALFILAVGYYWSQGRIEPNLWVLATPFLILLMGGFSMGLGMIISSLTTKYKDFAMLVGFGVSLWMFITPVILPASSFKGIMSKIIEWNPLTGIFECFKYAYLGLGDFNIGMLAYSSIFTIVSLIIGTIIFNKVQKSFMDTV